MESFENIRVPWPGWKVVKELGEGGYGKVYEIERTQHGITDTDALKIIRIPKNRRQYDELAYRMTSEDSEAINDVFSEQKNKVIEEIRSLQKLKYNDNIVGIKDWTVEKLDDGYSWEICIRMDVLTPMINYLKGKNPSDAETIKLGKDICRALVQCEKENIVHRDIKPDNIMVSESGKYMLTDFGIARYLEDETTMTGVGSKPYMAPEVANYQKSNKTVDLYSLGLVMYEMLNNNRHPFLNASGKYSAIEKEAAIQRRIKGEDIPEPVTGSDELKKLILKACSPDPTNRYSSAEEMLAALDALDKKTSEDSLHPEAPQPEEIIKIETYVEDETDTEVINELIAEDDVTESIASVVEVAESDGNEESGRLEGVITEPLQESTPFEPAHIPAADTSEPRFKGRKKIAIILGTIAAVLILVLTIGILIPFHKQAVMYENFKEVATENGWIVGSLRYPDFFDLWYRFTDAYTFAVKEHSEEGELEIRSDFFPNKKAYDEWVGVVFDDSSDDKVSSNLSIKEEDGKIEIRAFNNLTIYNATVDTEEKKREVLNLLEVLGIEMPPARTGHYLEETETIDGWKCGVYELDEPIVNAEWAEIGIKLTNVEGDPKGSYKLMFRSDGKWDNYWSVDLEESDISYVDKYNLGVEYKVEALALVPDAAKPDKYSCRFEVEGVMKLPSD